MSRLIKKWGMLGMFVNCRTGHLGLRTFACRLPSPSETSLADTRFLSTNSSDKSRLKYRPRRALLYVPGNDKRKILKISSLDVDCAVMDCEDGVAISKKAEAREVICRMLDEADFGRTELSVRINSIDSGLAAEDVAAVFQMKRCPRSLVVPKVESVEHVDWLADHLIRLAQPSVERSKSILRLIIMIEGARAFLDLDKICRQAQEKFENTPFALDAMIFGSDDFCASIGATRTKKSIEILYARQHFVIVAKAYRLQPIDMVYIDYNDVDGFLEQCVEGAQMGFTGKQVIHPSQIPVAQNAFMPSPQKIRWATEVIKAFEEHQKSGKGAFTFEGSMIDMPTVLQARNIVQLEDVIKEGKQ